MSVRTPSPLWMPLGTSCARAHDGDGARDATVRPPRTAGRALGWLGAVVAGSALLSWSASSQAAEESIIKHPGDHPRYSVEIEPHALAALIAPLWGNGYGLGVRFSIPLVDNGFISTINNNVAIGFGLDWVHYSGCWNGWYYNRNYPYACQDLNAFYVPVVFQWSFFFSTHFSAFVEPGIGFRYADWPQGCYWTDANGTHYGNCGPYGGGHLDFDPFIFAVGGRYHISERVSLTGRLGYPYFSFGVSFFP